MEKVLEYLEAHPEHGPVEDVAEGKKLYKAELDELYNLDTAVYGDSTVEEVEVAMGHIRKLHLVMKHATSGKFVEGALTAEDMKDAEETIAYLDTLIDLDANDDDDEVESCSGESYSTESNSVNDTPSVASGKAGGSSLSSSDDDEEEPVVNNKRKAEDCDSLREFVKGAFGKFIKEHDYEGETFGIKCGFCNEPSVKGCVVCKLFFCECHMKTRISCDGPKKKILSH